MLTQLSSTSLKWLFCVLYKQPVQAQTLLSQAAPALCSIASLQDNIMTITFHPRARQTPGGNRQVGCIVITTCKQGGLRVCCRVSTHPRRCFTHTTWNSTTCCSLNRASAAPARVTEHDEAHMYAVTDDCHLEVINCRSPFKLHEPSSGAHILMVQETTVFVGHCLMRKSRPYEVCLNQ